MEMKFEQQYRNNAASVMTNKEVLHLIRRLHDIARDPLVNRERKAPLILPESYSGLIKELRTLLLDQGRFEPLEHAGFQPFWNRNALMVYTPKGAFRVH